jgi:CubicO group peptidase (beta-lactamase class C family)
VGEHRAGALELLDRWDSPEAAAGVLGGTEPRVLAARGDRARRQSWASVTKLATALATLVAVEEGTVALDDRAGPPGSTVRHLLAHASGLAFDEDRVLAPPGRFRIYSNAGYEVLAATVAERAAMPFDRYVREGVLDPLGMSATRLEGTPAAGLVGSLDDLLQLAGELLAPTLVSQQTLDGATAVAFPGLAGVLPGFGRHEPLDWGSGFEVRDGKWPHWTGRHNSPATFGHFGASGSFLWVDPVAGLACAALSGRDFDQWARDVLGEALAAVPDDVIAHKVQPTGHPGPKILEEIERGRYDLVVLGSRGRGRAQEGLLGSVNGYLHFHSEVPLLSVPAASG